MTQTTVKRWRDMLRRELMRDIALRLRNALVVGGIVYGLAKWHSPISDGILIAVVVVCGVALMILYPLAVVGAFAVEDGNERQGITTGTVVIGGILVIFALPRSDAQHCPSFAMALHQSLSTLLNAPDTSTCVDRGWLLLLADIERVIGVVMFGLFLALMLRYLEARRKRQHMERPTE